MGSPITFSGFNGIDFNTILESVMQQARGPLTALETRQSGFKSQLTGIGKLTSQATALTQAAKDLEKTVAGDTVAASTTDATAVGVSTGTGAIAGRYDVVVESLARAQVTASTTTAADTNTTIVATGGTLTIGDTTVNVTGPVTLQQLATTINGTADIGVAASIVRSGAGAYKLVLTGKETGEDQTFTITDALTDGTMLFAGNAVEASDASILVNNVQATSSTNTFDTAVPGVTLTVLKADPDETIGINVTSNGAALKTRLESFIKSYNDLTSFVTDQRTASVKGDPGSLARDPMLRQLTTQLRAALGGEYGDDSLNRLSQLGLEFTLTGTLKLNSTKFDAAVTADADAVLALVGGTTGAFTSVATALASYTDSDGLLRSSRDRVQSQIRALDAQLTDAQDRLSIYRQTMQQEFLAAEMAMSRLRSQSGALSGVGQ